MKFQSQFMYFHSQKSFENVVCETVAILFRGRWINPLWPNSILVQVSACHLFCAKPLLSMLRQYLAKHTFVSNLESGVLMAHFSILSQLEISNYMNMIWKNLFPLTYIAINLTWKALSVNDNSSQRISYKISSDDLWAVPFIFPIMKLLI